MEMYQSTIGSLPCLVAGDGPPLVVLAGLSPYTGVGSPALRGVHEAAIRPWAQSRRVFYINLWPGMLRGITMAEIAARYADELTGRFGVPVDVMGISTGGSNAQQLAAEHPSVVRRLVLASTGCRLDVEVKLLMRRVNARLRAGAVPQALALMGATLIPGGPNGPLALAGGLAARIAGPRLFAAEGLADMATMIEAEDLFDLVGLPVIQAPTLILAGGRDRYYDRPLLEETARLIPGSRLEIRPKRGHITVLSDRRAIAQVHGFLSSP
jgi:pimeloyl-ACP methyl ester carboxylesterase